MTLPEQIREDINRAMKNGEALKLEVLRGLVSAIHNREIELRGTRPSEEGARQEGDLNEEEILTVLGREAKKRREANQIYTKAGRADLAEKESKEWEIIKTYLPPEMSAEEIEVVIRGVVEGGVRDFGQVMGKVVKETKGRAEPGTIKEIVERMLGSENGKKE